MHHHMYILVLNLLFPPLAVMLLTGLTSPETILNVVLFMLAIIPSYIHGFYVSWRYFYRQEKTERYQWEELQGDRRGRRKNSHSSSSAGSGGGRVYYGEVEEYSDTGYGRAALHPNHHRRQFPAQICYRNQDRRISGVPPPCPDPPSQDHNPRYLQ